MTKGYSELGGMRARLGGARGPCRFLVVAAILVALVVALNYWRLLSVNADLTERLHELEVLLQTANDRAAGAEAAQRDVGQDMHRVSSQLEGVRSELASSRDRLERTAAALRAAQEQNSELQLKHEVAVAGSEGSRERALEAQLVEAHAQLVDARQRSDTSSCSTDIDCDQRLKLVRFELETCRFAQQHGGNAGIHPQTGTGQLLIGGKPLDRLFESRGPAGLRRHSQQPPSGREQSPVAPPAAAAGAGAVAPAPPRAPPSSSTSAAPPPPPPEVAPVDGDVLPGEGELRPLPAAADVPGVVEGPAVVEDPAAVEGAVEDPAAVEDRAAGEDADAEQPPAEDGAGLLSRGGGQPPQPAPPAAPAQPDNSYPGQQREAAAHPAGEPAEAEGAAVGPAEDADGSVLGAAEDADDAVLVPDEGAAALGPAEDADGAVLGPAEDGDGAAAADGAEAARVSAGARIADAKDAALINGLQELAEVAAPAEVSEQGAAPAGGGAGDVAALAQRLDNMDGLPAADAV